MRLSSGRAATRANRSFIGSPIRYSNSSPCSYGEKARRTSSAQSVSNGEAPATTNTRRACGCRRRAMFSVAGKSTRVDTPITPAGRSRLPISRWSTAQ